MSITLPDRKAFIATDDEYGRCIKYKASTVTKNITVNPHVWNIINKLDGKYLKPSSFFVSFIQKSRLHFKNRPLCLDHNIIIIEDDEEGKIVFNKNNCDFIFKGTEGKIPICVY